MFFWDDVNLLILVFWFVLLGGLDIEDVEYVILKNIELFFIVIYLYI